MKSVANGVSLGVPDALTSGTTGQITFVSGSANLNIKNVVPGLYLLHLKDGQGNLFTQTFIIN